MTDNKGYGQYCPIAVAAEIVAERWTPLVLRGLFCGATRFNDIHGSVPRMSTAMLSRRLKELEYAQVIERRPAPGGRGGEYALTEAGRELFPVLDAMGAWSQKWLRREIVADKNLDPDVLMWELRQTGLAAGLRREKRRVVEFQLSGVPAAQRFYWLVFEPEDIDICVKNPGYDVDLWVAASLRTLIEIWLGHQSIHAALQADALQLDGDRSEIRAFPEWFSGSHFAEAGRKFADS